MKNLISCYFFLSLSLFAISGRADSIQTYFNHNKARSYTDPYYHRTRLGDNLEKVLLSTIEQAQKSISIAVYELDLPLVARALVRKKQQGVEVKLILDNSNSKIWKALNPEEISSLDEEVLAKYEEFVAFSDRDHDGVVSQAEQLKADSLMILKKGGISWIDDTSDGSSGSALMHHKFMIVDGQILITGSANFTRSCVHGDLTHPDSKGNANSLLRIENSDILQFFQGEFNEMFNLHHFGVKKLYRGAHRFKVNGSPVTIQFSPTSKKMSWKNSTNGLISRQFLDAKLSSDLALFVFSEQKIVDALDAARTNGMVNRTLIDPKFATRYYSELLDILGVELKSPACTTEIGNKPWINPGTQSGFTNLDEGDLLHHKFAVIDHHKVIVGSHNWSSSANNQNDEALFVIEDAVIAAHYSTEFENLFKKSTLGIPSWLAKSISDQNRSCR